MSTISFLVPYLQNVFHATEPKTSIGAIKEFPKWFAAGINPQEFLIPKKGEEVIVRLTEKKRFPDFHQFLSGVQNISEHRRLNENSHTIVLDDETRNHHHIKKLIYSHEGSIRSKYVRNTILINKMAKYFFHHPFAFEFYEIHPLKERENEDVLELNCNIRGLALGVQMRRINPIAAAAWTMREIIRLKPFTKQNRKIARLFASAFLQLGGYQAVFFPNKKKLNVAIRADFAEPGHLAIFLEKTVQWNQKQEGLNK